MASMALVLGQLIWHWCWASFHDIVARGELRGRAHPYLPGTPNSGLTWDYSYCSGYTFPVEHLYPMVTIIPQLACTHNDNSNLSPAILHGSAVLHGDTHQLGSPILQGDNKFMALMVQILCQRLQGSVNELQGHVIYWDCLDRASQLGTFWGIAGGLEHLYSLLQSVQHWPAWTSPQPPQRNSLVPVNWPTVQNLMQKQHQWT
ncbi:hypothetical protein BKA82DRAFT_4019458 [Pisolithus tinctorius]|nr:hypothetical protein BKA82DRAFT_4019458 [Pisolithus tinctorius]